VGNGDYSLYIVRCVDGSLYTGISTDVERRLREHASGRRGAKFLRGKGPLRLEYQYQLGDRSMAAQAEFYVKRLDRRDKEELIAGRRSLTELLPCLDTSRIQASGDACG
jgi:putative endonuclease